MGPSRQIKPSFDSKISHKHPKPIPNVWFQTNRSNRVMDVMHGDDWAPWTEQNSVDKWSLKWLVKDLMPIVRLRRRIIFDFANFKTHSSQSALSFRAQVFQTAIFGCKWIDGEWFKFFLWEAVDFLSYSQWFIGSCLRFLQSTRTSLLFWFVINSTPHSCLPKSLTWSPFISLIECWKSPCNVRENFQQISSLFSHSKSRVLNWISIKFRMPTFVLLHCMKDFKIYRFSFKPFEVFNCLSFFLCTVLRGVIQTWLLLVFTQSCHQWLGTNLDMNVLISNQLFARRRSIVWLMFWIWSFSVRNFAVPSLPTLSVRS